MSAKPTTDAAAAVPNPSAFERKWGKLLIAAGYGVVPNVVIQRHKQLGMDATELALYLLIASFWWKPNERPYPSILELAKGMGMDARNIQRRLQRMQAVGFIKIYKRKNRHGGNKTNEYDLNPLIKAATKIALEEGARKKTAALAKLGRKSPTLQVVKS